MRLAEKLRIMTAERAAEAGIGSINEKKPTLDEHFRFQNPISNNKITEQFGQRQAKTPALPLMFGC